ncbi:MAG: cbb3-type cytochrome c oxidase subunit II [Bacteroidia bacterium]
MHKFFWIPAVCMLVGLSAFRFIETPTSTAKEVITQDSSFVSPLVIYGSYVFKRENCGNCHSGWSYTMVPLGGELKKHTDAWHYQHLLDPSSISAYSGMPAYPHLHKQDLDMKVLAEQIEEKKKSTLVFPAGFEEKAAEILLEDANKMAKGLEEAGIKQDDLAKKEVLAVIAYLQSL